MPKRNSGSVGFRFQGSTGYTGSLGYVLTIYCAKLQNATGRLQATRRQSWSALPLPPSPSVWANFPTYSQFPTAAAYAAFIDFARMWFRCTALGEKHMSIMTTNALYNLISQHPLHIVLFCYLIILTISFRINKNKWQFQMIFIKVRITPCT